MMRSRHIVHSSDSYPVDLFPQAIRAAIVEVQKNTGAPWPLVANSALGALSVAAQGRFNVERPGGLK